MAAAIEIKYFNALILKKAVSDSFTPVYGGSFGIPTSIGGWPTNELIDSNNDKEWFLEESRIQGGFNETSVDLGVKAYIVEDQNEYSVRSSSMIYSGIYNSRTGINNTNRFSVGEDITASIDPSNGSIQKMYAEDTNLIIFQENKVSRSLIDKDAIYSAEGGGTVTSSNVVIGQNIPYAGNYGISKDPSSFAVYGYRKYFSDRYRNAILRLSQDGITEISSYGMTDFFRDSLNDINSYQYGQGLILGSWDSHNKQYVLSLQVERSNPSGYYSTLNFDDSINGFTSFFTFKPDTFFSIRNKFFSTKDGRLWIHYSENVPVCSFYGVQSKSSITFVFNDASSVSKNFKTINYEGDNGWQVDSFISDLQKQNYGSSFFNWQSYKDSTAQIPSYLMGAYDSNGNTYPALLTPPIYRYGFEIKENKYYANLVNNSSPANGEVIYGAQISGIKGRYATVTMSTDSITDYGGLKELWSVGSEYVMSSY
jgi:hypothetical protein